MDGNFICSVKIRKPLPADSYLTRLPAVRNLDRQGGLAFEKPVTFLAGENGTGKSTLLEAIAIAAGFKNRFGGEGLYLLDEPEAALSPSRLMTLLARIHDLVQKHSQFIIATHSPILMAYPGAVVYELTEDGIRAVDYRETEHYRLTRRFLEDPERMLRYLLEEHPPTG